VALARALDFVRTLEASRDGVAIGLIYDPGNPASVAEAMGLEAILGRGMRSKKGPLTTRLIPVDALHRDLPQVQAVLMTVGLSKHSAETARAASRFRLLTMTRCLDYVREGLCVLGVQDTPGPGVEIVFNESARQANGVAFDAAFKYLAKRIGGEK